MDSNIASVTFHHALVAMAAKLAAVDGTPNKAEYAAFAVLFSDGVMPESTLRSLFVKHVTDNSSALQYAREIAASTRGETDMHRELLSRLVRIASADAALNAAEIEMLRAVAAIFAINPSEFRTMIAQAMVPAGASPYEILGISARVNDIELRDHYMARVQMLHPDRYHAAGASKETITMLSDQLAAVNAAYQAVQKLRAKKSSRATSQSRWWQRRNAKGATVVST